MRSIHALVMLTALIAYSFQATAAEQPLASVQMAYNDDVDLALEAKKLYDRTMDEQGEAGNSLSNAINLLQQEAGILNASGFIDGPEALTADPNQRSGINSAEVSFGSAPDDIQPQVVLEAKSGATSRSKHVLAPVYYVDNGANMSVIGFVYVKYSFVLNGDASGQVTITLAKTVPFKTEGT